MAIIEKLHVHRFRNLSNQYLEPSKNINLLLGENAQGKTNFIEALYYLGHNRSFKTKRTKDVIPFDSDLLQVGAIIDNVRVLLKKTNSKSEITIDQQKAQNNSQLSQLLPTQIISPDRGFVVGGAPKLKRSYLDWGVFHIKPDLLITYKSYNKTLKNINLLLVKNNTKELEYWLSKLAHLSLDISKARLEYMEALNNIIDKTNKNDNIDFFRQIGDLSMNFQSGWARGVDPLNYDSVFEYLTTNTQSFVRLKHLGCGPHKANIEYLLNNKTEGHLSRGEQKNLSLVYWMVQVLLLVEKNIKPIVLIDDISSELDQHKINQTLQFLSALDVQIFITDIGNTDLSFSQEKVKTFRIQNGIISQ
ncbi:MAG: DNA replication and repair protein RecF [Gammaproteobacteria bacterium]|nr:DNA replication and repair protein RecF [Gammaproteobacteria bacterium]